MSLFTARFQQTFWPAFCLALGGLCAVPLVSAQTTLTVQDAKVLAATCFNCHGPNGQSSQSIPRLQGQEANRLLQRMQDFKAGKATDATVMTRLMKGYDDEQIRALAKWFANAGEQ